MVRVGLGQSETTENKSTKWSEWDWDRVGRPRTNLPSGQSGTRTRDSAGCEFDADFLLALGALRDDTKNGCVAD